MERSKQNTRFLLSDKKNEISLWKENLLQLSKDETNIKAEVACFCLCLTIDLNKISKNIFYPSKQTKILSRNRAWKLKVDSAF